MLALKVIMKLYASISASEYDEDYEMALVYCFDKVKNYCFSLSRFPDSKNIEVMVSDQINHYVDDLNIELQPNSIEVKLEKNIAKELDGTRNYTIEFNLTEPELKALSNALGKIFEGKVGFRNYAF